MNKKILTALACSAVILGLSACNSNEKTTSEQKKNEPTYQKEKESPKQKVAFKDVTTDQYLQNYNKSKDELAGQGIEILPFKFEFEESTKTYRFYYTKEDDYGKGGAKWVTVGLRRDGKTIDHLIYNGAPDINTIKAMVKATGVTWSDKLEKMIEGKESNKERDEMKVDGVQISIFGSPTDINVMVNAPMNL
ncbi:hypothetical protein V7024_17650 [Bacillus sp. JJ864]|uniref:hypothetical protein n=1 Tax=Bacillus sp. JJ864 TaxID=3122975 RepID=UPI002FFE404C